MLSFISINHCPAIAYNIFERVIISPKVNKSEHGILSIFLSLQLNEDRGVIGCIRMYLGEDV